MERKTFLKDFDKLGISRGETLREGLSEGDVNKYNAENVDNKMHLQ